VGWLQSTIQPQSQEVTAKRRRKSSRNLTVSSGCWLPNQRTYAAALSLCYAKPTICFANLGTSACGGLVSQSIHRRRSTRRSTAVICGFRLNALVAEHLAMSDLAVLRHVPTTCVHDLASRLTCEKCKRAGYKPRAALLQLSRGQRGSAALETPGPKSA